MKISDSPLLIGEQLAEFVAELSIETIPSLFYNDALKGPGITLITKSQVEFKDFPERPTGMPGNPISTVDLVVKFMSCATYGS